MAISIGGRNCRSGKSIKTVTADPQDRGVDFLPSPSKMLDLSSFPVGPVAAPAGPDGPANAGGPTTIIPSLPAAPPNPNWTSTVNIVTQDYVMASGQYLYSDQAMTMIQGDFYQQYKLVNDGTLWMDGMIPPNTTSPHWQYVLSNGGEVVNHGAAVDLAHDDSPRVGQSDAFAFFNFYKFTNSGQIFAWAEAGRAFALWSENFPSIVNSGLIAAYVEAGLATAIHLENGGAILNQAGGKILAEGPVATAISFYNAFMPSGWPDNIQINNAGLIQAHSTNVNIASVGISLVHASFQTMRVVNSGTITAEVAIIDQTSAEGNYSPVQSSSQLITNLAGGVINGDIVLERGNDALDNSGTIHGVVLLGEGDDRYDTTLGVQDGLVDLGWGADLFKGSAGADFAAGNDGADVMEGNGGNDQLMGGANNDTLTGGAGNDGLFGEYGNDLIVTRDGDFVWAGAGDDRIELGDYAFEHISGNEGFDTLVLPAGARLLDLSAALAEQALDGIDRIVLGGGKEIVVRAADVPFLSDGNVLRLDGGSTDTIDLIGAWAALGTIALDGVSYRQYQLAGATIFVSGAANVAVRDAAPAGATGLDPVAPGGLAPVPGDGPLEFTPNEKYLVQYVINESTTVSAEQTWWNDLGAPVLQSSSYGPTLTLTNHGHIWSWGDANTVGGPLELSSVALLENYGTITAQWTWDNAPGYAEKDLGGFVGTSRGTHIVNHGTIEALVAHGGATAVYEAYHLTNFAEIRAISDHGWAVGVMGVSVVDNRGLIRAEGAVSAIGVQFAPGQNGANAGRIEAHVTAPGGEESIGVRLSMQDPAFVYPFTNSGEIIADIAIKNVGTSSIALVNTGMVAGRIELSLANDRIDNSGTITAAVRLNDGNDVFDGHAGIQNGVIFGEGGNDSLTGGVGSDRLNGGAGADILEGGGGDDYFVYGAATDSTAASRDRIRAFQPGMDKIDLGALAPSSVTWVEFTDPSDNMIYNLVSVATAGGTISIRVDAANLSIADFIVEPPHQVNGTPADDVVVGTAGIDIIDGFAGNDILIGRGAADQLIGGAGIDTASYEGDAGGVFVNLRNGHGFGNSAQGDTYSGIENLIGTQFNDFLIGDDAVNRVDGSGGDDILLGGLGGDVLVGGSGSDTASYEDNWGPVFVNLRAGVGFGNAAQGDSYQSIENLTGGLFNDFFIGDDFVNRIDGGGGDDILLGGLGGDVLIGGTGSNTASYEDNWGAVFVNLSTGQGFNNAAEGDSYQQIQNLQGGLFNDFFIGDANANRLAGGSGNDTLIGAGGADIFVFDTAPGAGVLGTGNVDTISDFVTGADRIALDDAVFTGIGALGALNPNAFFAGTAAHDADDRIVYDAATGNLYFDADGNGAGAAILFATLQGTPTLISGDFVVI